MCETKTTTFPRLRIKAGAGWPWAVARAGLRWGIKAGSSLRFVRCLLPLQLSLQRLGGIQRVGPIGEPAVNRTDRGGTDPVVLSDRAAAGVLQILGKEYAGKENEFIFVSAILFSRQRKRGKVVQARILRVAKARPFTISCRSCPRERYSRPKPRGRVGPTRLLAREYPQRVHEPWALSTKDKELEMSDTSAKKSPRKGCVPGGRRTLTFPGAIGRFRAGPASSVKSLGRGGGKFLLVIEASRPRPCRR